MRSYGSMLRSSASSSASDSSTYGSSGILVPSQHILDRPIEPIRRPPNIGILTSIVQRLQPVQLCVRRYAPFALQFCPDHPATVGNLPRNDNAEVRKTRLGMLGAVGMVGQVTQRPRCLSDERKQCE